jgi:hypothetical protein
MKTSISLLFLVTGFYLIAANVRAEPLSVSNSEKLRNQRLAAAYTELPLRFEANSGQTSSRVRFLSRGLGYMLFLTSNEAVVVSANKAPNAVRMKLLGMNPTPQVHGLDELSSKSYYFTSSDP